VQKLRSGAVFHLHWVEGVISPSQIAALLGGGKKIVWTLHDMAPFTGGCHHSHDCFGYETNCNNCPQVRSVFRPAIASSHGNKKVFESNFKNLTVVATTEWMAEKARRSKIFSNTSVVVIPNPVSYEIFSKASAITSDTRVKPRSPNQLKLVLIANDLADETKGVEKLVVAAQAARVLSGCEISLILIGKNGHSFANKEGIDCRGELTQSQISECLIDCDALISASTSESFGLTIVEAAILGIPSIVLGGSGSSELVTHGVTGWVVQDFPELTHLLSTLAQEGSSALEDSGIRAKAVAMEKYSPDKIAEAYQKLYLNH
jgi:glycosyltransferase involved in cell wall biosynthesis